MLEHENSFYDNIKEDLSFLRVQKASHWHF